MNEPAGEVYEIVLEEAAGTRSAWRWLVVLVTNLLSMGSGPQNPGGMIISVRHRETGDELFRHIEDLGDDDGHLLQGIRRDLASMTALEFEAEWKS